MKNCRILAVDTFSTSALVDDGLIFVILIFFLRGGRIHQHLLFLLPDLCQVEGSLKATPRFFVKPGSWGEVGGAGTAKVHHKDFT